MKNLLAILLVSLVSSLAQTGVTFNTTNRLVSPTNLVFNGVVLTNVSGTNAAVVMDARGRLTNSVTTTTEVGYLTGASGNIQAQINSINNTINNLSGASGQLLGPYTNDPISLILDTDIGIDVDDAGDLAVTYALAKQGEIKLLAVMTPITNWFSAPTIEVFNRYYGFGDVPIGQSKSIVPGPGGDTWGSNTATNYYNSVVDGSNVIDAVTLYRRILASQPTNSVTIVFTGPQRNLLELYNSTADNYSILTGYQLITNKVARIITAAGYWPTNAAATNNNFTFDPASAAIITNINTAHTRVTYVGNELGNLVNTGGSITNKNTTDPIRNAWLLQFTGIPDTRRPAWAQIALLNAARGYTNKGTTIFNRVVGIADINGSTGANAWITNAALNQEYLTFAVSTNFYQTNLDQLVMLPAITGHDQIENGQTNISKLGFSGRDGASGYTNAFLFNTNAVIFDTLNYRYQFGRPFVVGGGQNDYNQQGRVMILGTPVSTTSITNYDKMLLMVRPQGPGVSFGQAASLDLVRYAPQNGAFEGMGALEINVGINQVSSGSDVTFNPAVRFRSDAISQFRGPVYLTNGLVGYPAIGFSSRTNSGFWVDDSTIEGEFDATIWGTNTIRFYRNGLAFKDGAGLTFLDGNIGVGSISSILNRWGAGGMQVLNASGAPGMLKVSTNIVDKLVFIGSTNSGWKIGGTDQLDFFVNNVVYGRLFENGYIVATNGGYFFLNNTFAGGGAFVSGLMVDGTGVRTTSDQVGTLSNHRAAEFQAGFPAIVNGGVTFYNTSNTNRFKLQAGVTGSDYVVTLPIDAPAVGEGLRISAVSGANVTTEWGSFSGGSGAPVGTMVSSGTGFLSRGVPVGTDTTGTNFISSSVTITSGTNLNTGALVVTNNASVGGNLTVTGNINGALSFSGVVANFSGNATFPDEINVQNEINLNGTNIVELLNQDRLVCVFTGNGSAITASSTYDLEIPFTCKIVSATLLCDQSGSIVIDVWKDTYANYPPTVADTITASAKPTVSSAIKSQDNTLTGWTTQLAKGDTLRFNVDSATTVQRAVLTLKVIKN